MKTTLLSLFTLLALSLAATTAFADAQCDNTLNASGLTPLCGDDICDAVRDSGQVHQICAGASAHMPFQAMACVNENTGAKKYFPAGQMMQQCNALRAQDPNWEPGSCYCCC